MPCGKKKRNTHKRTHYLWRVCHDYHAALVRHGTALCLVGADVLAGLCCFFFVWLAGSHLAIWGCRGVWALVALSCWWV
jgi:hypothetical protein